MSLRIAYFINQYPKNSHSFIRREIRALERQGLDIFRIAARGWDDELADAEDQQERHRTRYLLQAGIFPLLWAIFRTLLTRPWRFARALVLAIRMGHRAERSMPYHLAYLAEACRMLPWLSSYGATHIHAHFGTNSAEIVMLAHAMGGPKYSFTAHGSETVDGAQFNGIDEKIRHSDFVIAVCSFGRSQLYRWTQYEHWPKIHVVHCGLEPAFHDTPSVAFPENPRLVCVARLSKAKGLLLLIEAAHILNQKGIQFELVLAGDGEIRAQVQQLIDLHGLTRQVWITGWISSNRVRQEILSARGLILPSFSEGLPVVIMEAMALNRPVLATWVGGIPELVRPGETGWLFPPGCVDSIAEALETFLATPTENLMKMGNAAHHIIMKRHSIDIESRKLVELFQRSNA